jgi:ammonium transporter Rh
MKEVKSRHDVAAKLCSAVMNRDTEALNRLIEAKADPSAGDYDQRTALHIAACEGLVDFVKILVAANADVNALDRFQRTPLDEAVSHGKGDVAKFLRANGAEHSSTGVELMTTKLLNTVAKGKNTSAVANMIGNGYDVNCSDYDRRTPLHIAVANRKVDMVKLLLDSKADHLFQDRFGNSPYDEAMSIQNRSRVDPIQDLFHSRFPQLQETHDHATGTIVKIFAPLQIIMLILFIVFADYGFAEEEREFAEHGHKNPDFNYLTDVYGWFMDVHVMIFIGFGFLMTFLRKYDFGAVGLTFLVGAYSLQLHILVEGLVEYIMHGEPLHITIKSLILGDFSAGAVLITYGVVLGKISPVQLMMVCTLETIFYTINETIGIALGVTDIGGSMVIHMFGAFFGLTLALVMKNNWIKDLGQNCASTYHSDVFAMIGTVFLWMFWPSFNGVLGASDELRHLAVVNTVLSLSGSCVTAFLASKYFRGEFCMVDVQNATLAGGVAMGTSADLYGNPGVSILIGCIAGFVSVVGYTKLQPYLERTIGLHDTCGVNNLHGMPSIIGAIAGVIIVSTDSNSTFSVGNQVLFIIVTLVMAIGCGALTGVALKGLEPVKQQNLFSDGHYWEVPNEETPYYFDERGEIQREDEEGFSTEQSLMLLKRRLELLETKLGMAAGANLPIEDMLANAAGSQQNPAH